MPHLVAAARRDDVDRAHAAAARAVSCTGARAFLAPTSDGDSPADVLARVITAGVGLLVYDWAWGLVTELSRLVTSGLLGLPWVADGVRDDA